MSMKYSGALREWLMSLSVVDLSLLSTEVSLARNERLSRYPAYEQQNPGHKKCVHGEAYDCKRCFEPIINVLNKRRVKLWLHVVNERQPTDTRPEPLLELFEK